MKLSVTERLAVIELLKASVSNYLTLKLVRKIREECSFSDQEIVDYELKVLNDGYKWNPTKIQEKDIKVPDSVMAVLKGNLEALDKSNGITDLTLNLYERIVLHDEDGD